MAKERASAGGIVRHTERKNLLDFLLRRGTRLEDAYRVTSTREQQRKLAGRIAHSGKRGYTKSPFQPRKYEKPSAHARHIARMKQRNQGGKARVGS